MRNRVVSTAGMLALCVFVSQANAQTSPAGGRLLISISGTAQSGSEDLRSDTSFELYDETASLTTSQKVRTGGGGFDIGASYRVIDNFGVGIAYNAFQNTDSGTLQGSVPHPLFFDQPRSISASADALEFRQHVVHLQAVWFIPFVENVDFSVSAGPSFFSTRQAFVRDVSFEEAAPFTSVNVTGVGINRAKETSVGFNVGADVTYYITRTVGVGGTVRFTRSTVDFDLGNGQTTSLKVGGPQIGAGVRLRF